MSEAPLPTSALMQAASTLLLSALILTHPTTFHIEVRCFAQILFVSVRDVWLFLPDHIRLNCRRLLGLKKSRFTPLCFISLQSIYEDLF